MRMNREKVIKGLECCSKMSGDACRECPYGFLCLDTDLPYGMPHLAIDAIALLKAQEPRLLTSKDFSNSPIADAGGAIPCWKESKSPTRRSGWAVIVYGRWLADTENGTSRYWTSRPTDAQMEATPWPN